MSEATTQRRRRSSINLRLGEVHTRLLDAWRGRQSASPSRTAAAKQLLVSALTPHSRDAALFSGPFREKPEIDVEFHNPAGEPVGDTVAVLEVRINARGIVLHGSIRFTAPDNLIVGGYVVWIGDQRMTAKMNSRDLQKGDTYCIEFDIPISLTGEIDNRDRGPPEPVPPPVPQTREPARQE